MSVNKRQFELLQAMGITVWQRRDLSDQNSAEQPRDTDNATAPLPQHDAQASQINSQTPLANASADTSADRAAASFDTPAENPISLDLKILLKQQLFNDVLQCLGASSADISIAQNQVDLGIINWQFTSNDHIEFQHNCLTSPDLTTLANSPALKKALWQSIGPLSVL
ncbi:MAG: hypothetical protein ACPG52_12685 [Cognaticolwellia sp.]